MKRSAEITCAVEDSTAESGVDDSSLSNPTCTKRSKAEEGEELNEKEVHVKEEMVDNGIVHELSAGDAATPTDKLDYEQQSHLSEKSQSRGNSSSPERHALGSNQTIVPIVKKRKTKIKELEPSKLDWKNFDENKKKANASSISISPERSSGDEKAETTECMEQDVKIESGDSSSSDQVCIQPPIIPTQTTGTEITARIPQYGQPPVKVLSDTDIALPPMFGTKSTPLTEEKCLRMLLEKGGLPFSFGKKEESKSRAKSSERGPLGCNSEVKAISLSKPARCAVEGEENEEGMRESCCEDEEIDTRWDDKYKDLPPHTEPYIDSHCHLDFIQDRRYQNRHSTLESLRNEFEYAFPSTFKGCIANFIKPPYLNWPSVLKLVKDAQVLGSSWGIHPHYSGAATAESLDFLKKRITENKDLLKIVAIGECGIDLSGKNDVPLEKQIEVFKFQVDIAYELDLPIIIHCREGKGADKDPEEHILNILKDRPNHPIHRHCFTRDINVARRWMSTLHNCTFGFTPLVCYSEWFERLIKLIPLDRVHLETDAPYFVPNQYALFNQLKYSLPGAAITVAVRISEITGLSLDEVIRVTRMCTNRIYRLPRY